MRLVSGRYQNALQVLTPTLSYDLYRVTPDFPGLRKSQGFLNLNSRTEKRSVPFIQRVQARVAVLAIRSAIFSWRTSELASRMFEMRRPIEENISETRARFRGAPNFQELLGRSA